VALPDTYLAALQALALACERYSVMTGGGVAVLVGGAAAALYTAGALMSGDFDLVVAADDAFSQAMGESGFIKEVRTGFLERGFYHPDHPAYGFEQVSGRLFDGRADARRLVRILPSSGGSITLPSVEDMIADRLGQFAAGSPTDISRLVQARTLFRLAEVLDRDYLWKRIGEEGGDPALLPGSAEGEASP
jgi:hypothetical protein